MSKEVDARVEGWMAVSERERTCYVPQGKGEARCLARRVGKGIARPVRGLYARQDSWDKLEPAEQAVWIIRGMAGLRPGVAFCGPSAAVIHGLDVPWRALDRVHVAEPRGSHTRSDDLVIHHEYSGVLAGIDGVRVTPYMRTIADCLRWLPFPDALAVADSALKDTGWSAATLAAGVEEELSCCAGKAAAAKVALSADAASDNAGESLVRGVMLELGYANPVLQFEVPDLVEPWRKYFIDFAWLSEEDVPLVFGELDGYRKTENVAYMGGRSAERVLLDERRRESRISLLGVPIVRFSLAQALRDWEFALLLDSYGVPHAR